MTTVVRLKTYRCAKCGHEYETDLTTDCVNCGACLGCHGRAEYEYREVEEVRE